MKSSSSIFQNFKLKPHSSTSNSSAKSTPTNTSKSHTNANETSNSRRISKLFDTKSSKSAINFQNNTDNLRASILPTANSPFVHADKEQKATSYLSDALSNKIGSIYQIGYLGSAILTKGKTGLGCLQQPLRELYAIFRQQGSRLLQERRLFVSLDGISMFFSELGVEKCVHNELTSVYDVQLLKLACEQRKDKKIYCAFLPLGKLFGENINKFNF